jgi:hypothetical protein
MEPLRVRYIDATQTMPLAPPMDDLLYFKNERR